MMRVPVGLMKIAKESLRHILRRPVVGITAIATTDDGRILLVRRGDTGQWALPGGTVEWGETLRETLPRELQEEAGVEDCELGELIGVYSAPHRDPRFHAVTVVVRAKIGPVLGAPRNTVEIIEVDLFEPHALPQQLSHGNRDMLKNALAGEASFWE